MPRPTAKKPGHMQVHDSPENPRVRINRQVLFSICLLQLPFKAAMWSACVSSFSFERCLPTHLGAANDVGSLHLPWLPGLPTSLVAGVDTRLALSCLHESTLNSGLSQPGKKEKTFRQILPKHLIWPTSCNCKLNWGTSYALSKPGSHHKSQVPQAGTRPSHCTAERRTDASCLQLNRIYSNWVRKIYPAPVYLCRSLDFGILRRGLPLKRQELVLVQIPCRRRLKSHKKPQDQKQKCLW